VHHGGQSEHRGARVCGENVLDDTDGVIPVGAVDYDVVDLAVAAAVERD
jgi:hypothetical protein